MRGGDCVHVGAREVGDGDVDGDGDHFCFISGSILGVREWGINGGFWSDDIPGCKDIENTVTDLNVKLMHRLTLDAEVMIPLTI